MAHLTILGGISGGLGGGLSGIALRNFGWLGLVFMIFAVAFFITTAMWLFLSLKAIDAEQDGSANGG